MHSLEANSEAESLADEYWDYYRATEQLWNIDRGDVDQIEHWEDLSPEGVAIRVRRLEDFARHSEELAAGVSSGRVHSILAALSFSAGATAVSLPYARDLALVAGSFNFATFVAVLVPGYALTSVDHGRGYIAKLRSLPSFVDGWVAGLREGMASGRVATARGVEATVSAFDALLRTDIADDPLASQSPPVEASDLEVARWQAEVRDVIRDVARPAVARLRTALHDEVLPIARSDEQAGMCHLPGGAEGYHRLLWASTSTGLNAEAINQLGMEQLALLDDEYRAMGPGALMIDDPAQIRERLRSDASLRYASADEIVTDAMAALARAGTEAPRWFIRLPRAGCTAVAVNSGPLGYYTAPSPDGRRGGTFYFNATDPASWRRWLLEATTFHEAIPGHHLQLALAQELDLHPVLSELEVTGFSEGWGLYAERLADEMSLYSSPVQRLGMLAADSVRAARLVVDTGLHARAWTRDQAIDFLVDHTAMDRSNAETETDRYIGDPGQATSYMVGRLEIQRLRTLASERLSKRFSIIEFHDIVLGNGSTPLYELAKTVNDWVDQF